MGLFNNDEQYFKDILDTYEGSILIIDNTGKFLLCSNGTCKLVNMSKEDIIGQNAYDFLERGIFSHSTLTDCLETQKPAMSYLMIDHDPAKGIFAYSVPIFDENGQLARVIAFSQSESFSSVYTTAMENESRKMKEAINAVSNFKRTPSYIAVNPQTQNTFSFAKMISKTDTIIIINGESGTGKEVLAKYIHLESNRSEEVFIPVNCAAIPESLIESELFGYEKGAFTGADKNGKIGLFELANHGTLFLDEIGELPLHLQSTLLRALETGAIRRVGGKEEIKLDVRIVAATNRNLLDMVKEGTFREDLYYRLNVLPLTLQPLRQRIEDINPLTDFFLNIYNNKFNKHVTISDEYRAALHAYPWPGNVRELKNVIQRFVITDGNALYNTIHIPEAKLLSTDTEPQEDNYFRFHPSSSMTYKDFKSHYETEYFREILKETHGNINKVAQQTGLHISGIYKKLEKLKLNPKDYKNMP